MRVGVGVRQAQHRTIFRAALWLPVQVTLSNVAVTYPPPSGVDGDCASYQALQLLPALRSANATVTAVEASAFNVTAMQDAMFDVSSYGQVIG